MVVVRVGVLLLLLPRRRRLLLLVVVVPAARGRRRLLLLLLLLIHLGKFRLAGGRGASGPEGAAADGAAHLR
jgi:hypothetical protein